MAAAGNRPPSEFIAVILHRTSVPGNMGASARAMANTGFSRLILSDPRTSDMEAARRAAVSAAAILERAPACGSLLEAIKRSGSGFVVGTTARDRRYWDTRPIAEAAPVILKEALSRGAALLFGPEDQGLSNEELTLCHLVVTLPTRSPRTSYNLAHAVLLVLYHLMAEEEGTGAARAGGGVEKRAGFAEMEGMYAHLRELLLEGGFLRRDNPDHMMRGVREFLNRAEPTERDARLVRGACRKLLHAIRRKREG